MYEYIILIRFNRADGTDRLTRVLLSDLLESLKCTSGGSNDRQSVLILSKKILVLEIYQEEYFH